jgi:hypothetical protein
MNQREINTKMKEIKAALKELGFKKGRLPLDDDYRYIVGGHYCLNVKLMPEQKFCPVQIILKADYRDNTYDDDLYTFTNFAPDKLDRVIPALKKSIKILENMNKKFKQIIEHLEDFEKLGVI